jgi:hypothetical protein
MRQTGLGALLGAALVLLAGLMLTSRNQAAAQGNGNGQSGDLIAFSSPATEQRQQLIVIDPHTRAMAVYHVDLASGALSLKSVRNVQFDLMMSEFNGVSPSPHDIQSMLQQNH